MTETTAEKHERELRLLWRTTVLLLRNAGRLEALATATAGTPFGREAAEEAAVARRLEREVRRLARAREEEG